MLILNHWIIGSGAEPVVVLHEWMGDHSSYDPVIPYLNTDQVKWKSYYPTLKIADRCISADFCRAVSFAILTTHHNRS
jgi:hypothetical protein